MALPSLFPSLQKCADNFHFIINADPHVNREKIGQTPPHPHNQFLREFVKEVNGMSPQPAFVLFNGDLYERTGFPETTDNLLRIARDLKAMPIAVTGNHDCRDFDVDRIFRPVQQAFNGTTGDTFSFDCGQWHFVAMPTKELLTTREKEQAALNWLDKDLRTNRTRPTMVFVHHHILPVGTSQLEYYTYSIDYRNRLLAALTRYGNVEYVFSGHVHAGVLPSVKTAWRYKGANFIIAPSPVKPRPFGEEYDGFTMEGGYYLVVDIQGKHVRLLGRQIGRAGERVYPSTFREYTDAVDPRSLTPVWDLPAHPRFSAGAWRSPYRYISETEPGYVCRVTSENKSAHLAVREKGQGWAVGEFAELYQKIQTQPGAGPVLRASYEPGEASRGGGYIWVAGLAGKEAKCVMLFHWGPKMQATHPLPKVISYVISAGEEGNQGINALVRRKRAFFWPVAGEPGRTHRLSINLAEAMDQASGESGAFHALGVDQMIVAMGAWCSIPAGSRSEARFADMDIGFDDRLKTVTVDGNPLDTRRNGLNLILESRNGVEDAPR